MSEQPDFSRVCDSTLGEELTSDECRVLASIMGQRRLQAHEILVREGEGDSTLFLLVDGRLEVVSRNDDGEEVVYTMQPGECAGTRAFVDRTPRKATLRAGSETCLVYTLEPDRFESLLKQYPEVVYKVMRALFRITHANLMRMNQETRELTNYITKSHGRY